MSNQENPKNDVTNQSPQPKKRGRPPKQKSESDAKERGVSQPKKRGRKVKGEINKEEMIKLFESELKNLIDEKQSLEKEFEVLKQANLPIPTIFKLVSEELEDISSDISDGQEALNELLAGDDE